MRRIIAFWGLRRLGRPRVVVKSEETIQSNQRHHKNCLKSTIFDDFLFPTPPSPRKTKKKNERENCIWFGQFPKNN